MRCKCGKLDLSYDIENKIFYCKNCKSRVDIDPEKLINAAMYVVQKETVNSINNSNLSELNKIKSSLEDFDAQIKENVQHKLRNDAIKILTKLKTKQQLNETEIDALRYFLIGDAEYYVKEDVSEIIHSIKKTLEGIKYYSKREDVLSLSKLRAFLKDLKNNLGIVATYLEARERIDNFDKNMNNIDANRKMLIYVLEQKLKT
ncbi:MAG: hypothetical protein J7L10_01785 [Methanomicrobia archaeon]|nr:hypothetical protein [Methanomicrobia archaeon]RLF94745.1 MAG: hypothetical protein DRN45_02740 [Thermococci archaeon]RLF95743.1 MAG: hypothetical protein DRN50_03250 [Thermococci archaeon]RLF98832.1 MAG: hypothetical protein DRN58_06240 [Thermococci archaeon]HEC88869.1 hypothetical protein [Thermoplasmata archaeon]